MGHRLGFPSPRISPFPVAVLPLSRLTMARLGASQRHVVEAMARSRRRLTLAALMTALEAHFNPWSEATVRRALARLRRLNVVVRCPRGLWDFVGEPGVARLCPDCSRRLWCYVDEAGGEAWCCPVCFPPTDGESTSASCPMCYHREEV